MTVSRRTTYRGRKAKVGGVCFTDTGRLAFFLDYCPCCQGKIMLDVQESEEFARKFFRAKRHNLKQRLATWLLKQPAAQ